MNHRRRTIAETLYLAYPVQVSIFCRNVRRQAAHSPRPGRILPPPAFCLLGSPFCGKSVTDRLTWAKVTLTDAERACTISWVTLCLDGSAELYARYEKSSMKRKTKKGSRDLAEVFISLSFPSTYDANQKLKDQLPFYLTYDFHSLFCSLFDDYG